MCLMKLPANLPFIHYERFKTISFYTLIYDRSKCTFV